MKSVKTNVLHLPALFFSLVLTVVTYSQGVQTFRPNVNINPNCNGYIEYLPEGYSTSGQTYPLLVFLEGIGETGDGSLADLQKLLNNGPPKYISQNNFPSSFTVNGQTHRLIIFTPQIKIPIWMRYPTAQEINSIIDYAVQHYRVNTSRIYLIGISTGAGSVWNYCSETATYSNRIAAIAPFTGTDTPTIAKARVIAGTNLPIWAFHNRFDEGVNVTYTTGWTDTITMLGSNPPPKVTLFNASGHDSWYNPLLGTYKENNMNVYEWMLQYTRGASPPPNQAPTANAGPNQTITLPTSSVTLNGSGSDPDGTIVSYSWSKFSGPSGGTISNPSSASTSVTGLVQGTYVFRLTVTDNQGATGTSNVTVTVNAAPNQPPTANAGPDKTITLPTNSVQLNGSGSDPDGTISSYSWTKISGGSATINTPSSASTTVSGLTQGTYIFRLTVTDNGGASASNDVTVTVNAAANQTPTVSAGGDKTITLPTNSVTLTGTASDPDGSIASYAWTKVSGGAATIGSPSSASTAITGLAQGSYVFRLTVRDNDGATASDDVNVTVNAAANQAPTVSAGTDKTITLPTNSVSLTGSASDPDGSIASYAWTKVSGGSATISSPSSASTTISGLTQGSYVFRLTVTDNSGATASDDVNVTVNAQSSPTTKIEAENWTSMSGVLTENTLDVGGGKNVGWIELGDWMEYSVNVASPGSYTLNLRIATPNSGAQLQIKNSSGALLSTVSLPTTGGWQSWQTISTTITLVQGAQTIRLQSSSSAGWNINWLEVVGASSSNQAPTVSAGTDKTITLPTNSVSLTGTASDPDGSIASYSWTKVSGGSATIGSPSSASTTVSGLTQGSYVFRLTVTDNSGATASDDVNVTVNAQSSPTTKIEAENWTSMSGVLTENTLDVGGGKNVGWIELGDWMEYSVNVASPGSYTLNLRIATPNSGAQLQIKNSSGALLSTVSLPTTGGWQSWQTISTTITLVQGAQTIRLQSSSSAGWNINWLEVVGASSSNQAPTVSAGTDKTITLPTNSVTLSGTASDPDGSIASYAWTKVSGGSATIGSPSSASTTVSGLTQGSYVFRLTVTDNDGATASDQVSVTVNAAAGSTTHIEAENYTNMSGVQKENTTDVGGGQSVGYIDPGDWMEYSYNAPSSGSYTVNLRVASPASGGQLEIRKPDGTVLATVNVPNTGGWQSWQTISTTISLVQGAQTIRIVSTSAPWKGWNINWWELAPGSVGFVTQRTTVPESGNETASFEVFPNPAGDRVLLTLTDAYAGNVKVQIISMAGRLVKEFSFSKPAGRSQKDLFIGDLAKGSYFIRLQMKEKSQSKQILKQ